MIKVNTITICKNGIFSVIKLCKEIKPLNRGEKTGKKYIERITVDILG